MQSPVFFRLSAPLTCALLALPALTLPAQAQPVLPRAVGPTLPKAQTTAPKPAGPQVKPGEVDWRGISDTPRKKPTAGSDGGVGALVRNAPYRLEVASSDGQKLTLTNALTLERRRLVDGAVAGYAFSADGAWLYVVTGEGELLAVEPETAAIDKLGKLALSADQVVVEVTAAGSATQHDVSIWVAKGTAPALGTCPTWREPARIRAKRDATKKGAAKLSTEAGWPEQGKGGHLASISPNTKYRAQAGDGGLTATARFGGGEWKLNRSALPAGIHELQWMRDSDGLVAVYGRKPEPGCKQRPGVRVWRDDDRPNPPPGWQEWTAPESVQLARPDLKSTLDWAPDGMRLLGVDPRGVVMVEPAPRFRGVVAVIAPATRLWPKFRPGQRALPASAPPHLRHAEILMELGDLDAAGKLLKAAKETDAPGLWTRWRKLEEVRKRRAEEMRVDIAELRSDKSQHSTPKPLPTTVEPAATTPDPAPTVAPEVPTPTPDSTIAPETAPTPAPATAPPAAPTPPPESDKNPH